ncbi:5060_t:CDS:10 [Paraglomus occultum]|uniref:ATP-dependent RNA helicase n=1 Tax=Paraglomus occultum TaxID=144539 RepID=A0A9N8Z8K1_9GLOM|nr:5060_t:CDS:10 [Paraglomus occultum]
MSLTENPKQWIEKNVQSGYLSYYNEEDLSHRTKIGAGGFGSDYKAVLRQSGSTVTITSLSRNKERPKKDFYKVLVKELSKHQQVANHPNIVQFLGLSKDSSSNYLAIFEYADGGTLRSRSEAFYYTSTWESKLSLCLGIVNGLKYLHELDIVHNHLNSHNIIFCKGIPKITGFGLASMNAHTISKYENDGIQAYVDPLSLADVSYQRGKESDIFSLGVILWEISSGQRPCEGMTSAASIIEFRLNGSRDEPVLGTPEDYIDLYSECWDEDPDDRPSCEDVHERLMVLSREFETEKDQFRCLLADRNYGDEDKENAQEDKVANERLLRINQFVSKKSKRKHGVIENGQEKSPIEQKPEPKKKRREKKSLQATVSEEEPIADTSEPLQSSSEPSTSLSSAQPLQAFPKFVPRVLSQQAKLQLKKLGLPAWLANPIIVDPSRSETIDETNVKLSQSTLDNCQALGITEFFAVQTAVLPLLLKDNTRALYSSHRHFGDICISAPTGSGKTLAYVIPIVEILSTRVVCRLRALIVLPTRDLVAQVKENFDAFCKGTDLKVGVMTGQTSFVNEQSQIVGNSKDVLVGGNSKVDILIATPGRLIDHINSTPNFTLQHLRFLVVDEADRLLNQSYHDWLSTVLKALKPKKEAAEHGLNGYSIYDAVSPAWVSTVFHIPPTDISVSKTSSLQKLLFSATLTRNPAKIASLQLQNPQYVAVQGALTDDVRYTLPSTLKEYMIITESSQKPLIVLHILHNLEIKSALCFTKSVESAHRLALLIQFFEQMHRPEGKFTASEYSSDLSQQERTNILKRFKEGELKLLIASDLIARGMDLDNVDVVINYDVPVYMKKYVHRVGRTARAGREGIAYSIVETQEARYFKEMLSRAGHLKEVRKLSIKPSKLEPMMSSYTKSLDALKEHMTNIRNPH